jgi:hypothetical protein
MADLKSRLDRGEGSSTGVHQSQTDAMTRRGQGMQAMFGWIAASIGFVTTIALVIALAIHH